MIAKKKIQVKKWGNGSGIRLPRVFLDMLSIKTDDFLDISIQDETIIISPIRKKHMTLAQRFEQYDGMTKQEEYWSDHTFGKELL